MDARSRLLPRRLAYDPWSAAGLNLMVGLWLILSPWIVGYDQTRAYWVPVLTGALVVASAGLRLGSTLGGRAFHVIDLVLAGWLVAPAIWIADGWKPAWNDVISAAVLAALAVVGLLAQSRHSDQASLRGRWSHPAVRGVLLGCIATERPE